MFSVIIKSWELSCISVNVGGDSKNVKYQVSFSNSFFFFLIFQLALIDLLAITSS